MPPHSGQHRRRCWHVLPCSWHQDWCRRRSAHINRALQLHGSTTDAMKRKHTRVASLPADCLAAVLALLPFRHR